MFFTLFCLVLPLVMLARLQPRHPTFEIQALRYFHSKNVLGATRFLHHNLTRRFALFDYKFTSRPLEHMR